MVNQLVKYSLKGNNPSGGKEHVGKSVVIGGCGECAGVYGWQWGTRDRVTSCFSNLRQDYGELYRDRCLSKSKVINRFGHGDQCKCQETGREKT